MKTKQELLEFYGVEIGKKYRITKTTDKLEDSFEGEVFRVLENTYRKDGLEVVFYTFGHPIAILNYLDYEEYEPILDDKEREYLQHYVMDNPAFKGKVKSIQKWQSSVSKKEALLIYVNYEFLSLPKFELGSMYKGMKLDYAYTPKELGLEE